MSRTLWTVSAAGLLAVCMTSCGAPGKDYVSEICLKLESCSSLDKMGSTTVGECKNAAIKGMIPPDGGSSRTAVEAELDKCMAMTQCSEFADCVFTSIPPPPPPPCTCTCSPQPCTCTCQ